MKVLLDTSVMVAAHLPTYPDYAVASAWLSAGKQKAYDLFVSAHSLVEVYAVLTRLPAKPKIKGPTAWRFLEENVIPVATVIAVSRDDYSKLLARRQFQAWWAEPCTMRSSQRRRSWPKWTTW